MDYSVRQFHLVVDEIFKTLIINKIPGKIQINRKDITNGRNYVIGDSGAAARRICITTS
jgi:hypothetical protein